jgi:hypothetical protein
MLRGHLLLHSQPLPSLSNFGASRLAGALQAPELADQELDGSSRPGNLGDRHLANGTPGSSRARRLSIERHRQCSVWSRDLGDGAGSGRSLL